MKMTQWHVTEVDPIDLIGQTVGVQFSNTDGSYVTSTLWGTVAYVFIDPVRNNSHEAPYMSIGMSPGSTVNLTNSHVPARGEGSPLRLPYLRIMR